MPKKKKAELLTIFALRLDMENLRSRLEMSWIQACSSKSGEIKRAFEFLLKLKCTLNFSISKKSCLFKKVANFVSD